VVTDCPPRFTLVVGQTCRLGCSPRRRDGAVIALKLGSRGLGDGNLFLAPERRPVGASACLQLG